MQEKMDKIKNKNKQKSKIKKKNNEKTNQKSIEQLNNSKNLNLNIKPINIESKEDLKQDLTNQDNIYEKYATEFYQCECGALVNLSEDKCWSCNRQIPLNLIEKNKDQIINSVDPLSLELLQKVQYNKFISCPKCGANNEIFSSKTVCWACSKEIDTSAIWNSIAYSYQQKITQQKTELENLKISTKAKENIRYVLHCSNCNAWFVSLTHSPNMVCPYCKKEKKVFVSYNCPKCGKLFDLNKIADQKCPYCKNILILTKEEMLY